MSCSSKPPIDPQMVEVSLSIQPEVVSVGIPVELTVEFLGAEFEQHAEVVIDIRLQEEAKLIEASRQHDGTYTAKYTFLESRLFDIYIHLYQDDLHIIKKKQVNVK